MRSTAAVIVLLAALLVVLFPRSAPAFGDAGGFDPRVLLTGTQSDVPHASAPARWSWELVQRTSAPAKTNPSRVRADSADVTHDSFLYWSGSQAPAPLTASEVAGLRRFFSLGGVMLVDDASPGNAGEPSAFMTSARREIARVLPDTAPISLGTDHVIFRSFYLLTRAEGRVLGGRALDGIVRGGQAQVIFSSNDIGGTLARSATGAWEEPVTPGGDPQRERGIRLAVNIAMYVLCSNYKDDQVHAQFLMRRRAALLGP